VAARGHHRRAAQPVWDVVVAVELPELEPVAASELRIVAYEDGAVDVDDASLGPAARRIAQILDEELERPYEARAVRRGVRDWSVAARQIDADRVELPELEGIEELTVARTPDGERTVFADGDEVEPEGELGVAAATLEERARERFDAFAARAVRGGDGWTLTVDPL
jgi:hypothetical protein